MEWRSIVAQIQEVVDYVMSWPPVEGNDNDFWANVHRENHASEQAAYIHVYAGHLMQATQNYVECPKCHGFRFYLYGTDYVWCHRCNCFGEVEVGTEYDWNPPEHPINADCLWSIPFPHCATVCATVKILGAGECDSVCPGKGEI